MDKEISSEIYELQYRIRELEDRIDTLEEELIDIREKLNELDTETEELLEKTDAGECHHTWIAFTPLIAAVIGMIIFAIMAAVLLVDKN